MSIATLSSDTIAGPATVKFGPFKVVVEPVNMPRWALMVAALLVAPIWSQPTTKLLLFIAMLSCSIWSGSVCWAELTWNSFPWPVPARLNRRASMS